MNKSIGPPPFIDPLQQQWRLAFNLEESRALESNKAKLEELRRRDQRRTEERIDGLYDELQRAVAPDYRRAPNASDIERIYALAQRLIGTWHW
ncbi:hypothetical protein [Pseudomonas sp. CF161]|jgi:hypothetical protein|uniref:hypothetical protein n=1 Tax=Pseudomonas sp. CF161 TaxID=911241 RepID=UPI0012EC0F3E|nr:hypothetical protein [Pseudomonas sp. CF161]